MADEHIVAMKAADDAHMKMEMPSTVPEGFEGIQFHKITFPMGGTFAILKNKLDEFEYWGPFTADDFVVDDRNIYTAHDHRTGEPVILRMTQPQKFIGDPMSWYLRCVDDNGEEVGYVLQFIPDNTLDIQEPDMGQERIQTQFDEDFRS